MNRSAERIFDRSLAALGLQYSIKTDPDLMKTILKEMQFSDLKTKNIRMQKFFEEIVSKPKSLRSMLICIKKAILTKHPAIIEFAGLALQKKWFKSSPHILAAVHRLYVLETVTSCMCNDHEFFLEVQEHYKMHERRRGVDTMHPLIALLHAFRISPNIFKVAKSFSVDPAMIYLRLLRGFSTSPLKAIELQALLEHKKINYIEYKLLSPKHERDMEHLLELVRINIYEAGTTEKYHGLGDNALCAHALAEDLKKHPPKTGFSKKPVIPTHAKGALYGSERKGTTRFPSIQVSQEWASLYVTWNMTFILKNLDNLDILFPKLLLPTLLDCKPSAFMGVRATSLWLTINQCVFREYAGKKHVAPIAHREEMARAWARINTEYAFALAKREADEDAGTLKKGYAKFFAHPIWHIFQLARKLY